VPRIGWSDKSSTARTASTVRWGCRFWSGIARGRACPTRTTAAHWGSGLPEPHDKLSYNRVVSRSASALELNPTLRTLLSELRRRFEDLYRDRLVRLVLFGSHARGGVEPWSDVDVLVVLKGPVHPGQEIRRTSAPVAELCLRNNVVISRLFVDDAAFLTSDSPLLENVRAEGIEL